jgi:uncharacterized protein
MAKAPIAGSVKRRLARDIGEAAALRFYRATLFRTLRSLGADPRWRTYLAVTPDTARTAAYWPPPANIARIAQGAGDLGARMQTLFDSMPPGPVVIVGSDIPAIRPAHIARAFALLGRADAVFGPAKDGGYWLVGLKRSPARLAPFAHVPWSTDAALAATAANLRGKKVAYAHALSDVDNADSYRRERAAAMRLVPSRIECAEQ